jgi:hypothetical protein
MLNVYPTHFQETAMSNTDLMQERNTEAVKQPKRPGSGPQSQTFDERLKPDVHTPKNKETDVAPERDESEQLRHHQ